MHNVKKDFPLLSNHPDLHYLDSTATTLKPQAVIDAERDYYEKVGATIHRGVYDLSMQATELYEGTRENVRQFINAKSTKEIIFVRGATEAINLVAATFGQSLRKGDSILISEMEHHANIVPWQALVGWIGVELRWIPVTDNGDLDLSNLDALLKGVKLVAVSQMSNVLGVMNDVKLIAQKAHAVGAKVLVDAAQAVPHMPVDVQNIDADFLVFSAHKMLGPTGVGVLYGKEPILQEMPPYQRGGDMILEVTKESATWNDLPTKFEAGTPNIAGVVAFGAAIAYLNKLGMENVWKHDRELSDYGIEQLSKLKGVRILGAKAQSPRAAIFAMEIQGVHPHDIGSILNDHHVAVRAGHHCAMVLHKRFGMAASTRASCYVYTTKEDIDALVEAIKKAQEIFA